MNLTSSSFEVQLQETKNLAESIFLTVSLIFVVNDLSLVYIQLYSIYMLSINVNFFFRPLLA